MTMTDTYTDEVRTGTPLFLDVHRLRVALAATDPFRSTDRSRFVLTVHRVVLTPADGAVDVLVEATNSFIAARATYRDMGAHVGERLEVLLAGETAKLTSLPLWSAPIGEGHQHLELTSAAGAQVLSWSGIPVSTTPGYVEYPATDTMFAEPSGGERIAADKPVSFDPALFAAIDKAQKAANRAAGITPSKAGKQTATLTHVADPYKPLRFTFTAAGTVDVQVLAMPVRVQS